MRSILIQPGTTKNKVSMISNLITPGKQMSDQSPKTSISAGFEPATSLNALPNQIFSEVSLSALLGDSFLERSS